MKLSERKFWNIPNCLSLVRLALVPAFVVLYFRKEDVPATLILIASGLTDFVDGYIARHFNQITEIGKMLDPFADKLTQGAVAVVLAARYPIVAPLLIIFIVKEFCMLLGGLIILRQGMRPSPAKWWGKLATIVFYMVMIAVVAFGNGGFFGIRLPQNALVALVSIAAVFMIFSFINYFPMFVKYIRDAHSRRTGAADDDNRENAVRKQ